MSGLTPAPPALPPAAPVCCLPLPTWSDPCINPVDRWRVHADPMIRHGTCSARGITRLHGSGGRRGKWFHLPSSHRPWTYAAGPASEDDLIIHAQTLPTFMPRPGSRPFSWLCASEAVMSADCERRNHWGTTPVGRPEPQGKESLTRCSLDGCR